MNPLISKADANPLDFSPPILRLKDTAPNPFKRHENDHPQLAEERSRLFKAKQEISAAEQVKKKLEETVPHYRYKDDGIYGSKGNVTQLGRTCDDTLQGLNGTDVLLGGNGNKFDGGSGDDDQIGQGSDNRLNGDTGRDIFHLAFGIGNDVVHELSWETSLIRQGASLCASEFLSKREGNDLAQRIAGTNDKLTPRGRVLRSTRKNAPNRISASLPEPTPAANEHIWRNAA
ncbi:MAG TPA: calcium-binding protein [Azonexus sp.]|nr:calcium-binding protein [Azonexus sp.]